MGLLGVLTAGTVAFGVWNWRGVRAASAQNTQAFVSLSIERARRLRRAIRAGWVVLTIEVAVFVPWVWYRLYGLGGIAVACSGTLWLGLSGRHDRVGDDLPRVDERSGVARRTAARRAARGDDD